MILRVALVIALLQIINAQIDSETEDPIADDEAAKVDDLDHNISDETDSTADQKEPTADDKEPTANDKDSTVIDIGSLHDDKEPTVNDKDSIADDKEPTADENVALDEDNLSYVLDAPTNEGESGDDDGISLTIANHADETTSSSPQFRATIEPDPPRNTLQRISLQHIPVIGNPPPLDLFKIRRGDLRRHKSDIWNWDHWCQMQPSVGNCTQRLSRYYYDSQLDQCQTFVYSGCSANKNNFYDITDCERHCKGASFITLKDASLSAPCTAQPSSGLCLALMPRFYYDVNEYRCKPFMYGGCGGNGNNFPNVRECMDACHGY